MTTYVQRNGFSHLLVRFDDDLRRRPLYTNAGTYLHQNRRLGVVVSLPGWLAEKSTPLTDPSDELFTYDEEG